MHPYDIPCAGDACLQCERERLESRIIGFNWYPSRPVECRELVKQRLQVPILYRLSDLVPALLPRAWIEGAVPEDDDHADRVEFKRMCASVQDGAQRVFGPDMLCTIYNRIKPLSPRVEAELGLQMDVLQRCGAVLTTVRRHVFVQKAHAEGELALLDQRLVKHNVVGCGCRSGRPCLFSQDALVMSVVNGGAEGPFFNAIAMLRADLGARPVEVAILDNLETDIRRNSPHCRALALAMAAHPRLGPASPIAVLSAELLRLVVDPVPPRMVVWEGVYAGLLVD